MMRQGSNSGRRPRGRTNRKQHGGGGGQSRTHTYDSNGPDGRVRGNARQVYEKYLTLARDASSAGDRIAAEAYYQHAEHYFRILSDSTDPQSGNRRPEERRQQTNGGEETVSAADGESRANGASVPTPEAAEHRNGASVLQEEQPSLEASPQELNGEEGEAPPRARRGRPRKPRTGENGKAAKKEDSASETEDGPAVG